MLVDSTVENMLPADIISEMLACQETVTQKRKAMHGSTEVPQKRQKLPDTQLVRPASLNQSKPSGFFGFALQSKTRQNQHYF